MYFIDLYLHVPSCFPVFRFSGFPVFRFSGFSVFRFSGFPVFRFFGFPVFRFSGFPVFRFSGFPVFPFFDFLHFRDQFFRFSRQKIIFFLHLLLFFRFCPIKHWRNIFSENQKI
jgi:hypothetical protein